VPRPSSYPVGTLGNGGTAWHSRISDFPHWIELRLPAPRPLERLDIYWGPRRLWPQAVRLEAWGGAEWHNVPGADEWHRVQSQHTRFKLAGTTADRLRPSVVMYLLLNVESEPLNRSR
jgi:hypothetical protein